MLLRQTVLLGKCPPTRFKWAKLMTSLQCQSLKHKTSAFQPLKIINTAFSAFLNVESAVCLKGLLVAFWVWLSFWYFFVVVLFWHFFVGRKKPQQLLEMVNNISEYWFGQIGYIAEPAEGSCLTNVWRTSCSSKIRSKACIIFPCLHWKSCVFKNSARKDKT